MTPTEQDKELQFCESCNCMTRGNPTCGRCGAWRETETMTPTEQDNELREKLAAIEHERWADWQRWCNKVLRENNPSPEQGDILERWDRQIETPYEKLSEREKASDMEQVDRYWQLITADRKRMALEAAIMGAKFGNAAIRQYNIANPTEPMNLDAVRDSGIQQAKAWAEQQC